MSPIPFSPLRACTKVFDDANLDRAVDGAMSAKFRFGGQVCIAPNRFLVQEGIYDAFVARMAGRINALCVGDGLEPHTNMGPLINFAARDKVKPSNAVGRTGIIQ